METAIKRQVRDRAGDRCEYCLLPQMEQVYSFHMEHIVPRQHGGPDALENLCLACPPCNLGKGTNLSGIDPDTGLVTRLFNPRQDAWHEHFQVLEGRVIGRTAVGRTTAWLLKMNTAPRVAQRLRLGGENR